MTPDFSLPRRIEIIKRELEAGIIQPYKNQLMSITAINVPNELSIKQVSEKITKVVKR